MPYAHCDFDDIQCEDVYTREDPRDEDRIDPSDERDMDRFYEDHPGIEPDPVESENDPYVVDPYDGDGDSDVECYYFTD